MRPIVALACALCIAIVATVGLHQIRLAIDRTAASVVRLTEAVEAQTATRVRAVEAAVQRIHTGVWDCPLSPPRGPRECRLLTVKAGPLWSGEP